MVVTCMVVTNRCFLMNESYSQPKAIVNCQEGVSSGVESRGVPKWENSRPHTPVHLEFTNRALSRATARSRMAAASTCSATDNVMWICSMEKFYGDARGNE